MVYFEESQLDVIIYAALVLLILEKLSKDLEKEALTDMKGRYVQHNTSCLKNMLNVWVLLFIYLFIFYLFSSVTDFYLFFFLLTDQ